MEEQEQRAMTKEEILDRSRKENAKAGDEREQAKWKYYPYCGTFGAILAILVCMVVFISVKADDLYLNTLMVILSTMMTAQLVFQTIVTKPRKIKIVVAVCAATVALCTVGEWVIFGLAVAAL